MILTTEQIQYKGQFTTVVIEKDFKFHFGHFSDCDFVRVDIEIGKASFGFPSTIEKLVAIRDAIENVIAKRKGGAK